MAYSHTYVSLYDGDEVTVDACANRVRVEMGVGVMFVTPTVARTLAAGLMIAADQLDPQDDDPEVARTLRGVINGGAS